MAGGDNQYSWTHTDGRSLETADDHASKFLQLQQPVDVLYSSIQSAVNDAYLIGHPIVNVSSGTYNENVYIGSDIVVYGAGRNNTTINGTADVDGVIGNIVPSSKT